jgi:hypothetical protein
VLGELDGWLADPVPKMLIVGELQDGLVFERSFAKVTGRPLTHWIIPRFAAQDRHRLIFLTKSAEVEFALSCRPRRRRSFPSRSTPRRWRRGGRWALRRWARRLEAAGRMKAAGWPVRFRLDPMVPYPGWREGYAATIDEINRIEPEMVTLGALRATSGRSLRSAARKNGRDDGIFEFLTEERDASGFKYRIPYEQQLMLFRFALERLSPRVVPALCKEDQRLWRDLGMRFRGCHCLLGAEDAVVAEAPAAVRRLRGDTKRQRAGREVESVHRRRTPRRANSERTRLPCARGSTSRPRSRASISKSAPNRR